MRAGAGQSVTHVALDVRQACLMEAVDCFCAMIPDQVPPPCAQNVGGTRTLKPSDNHSPPENCCCSCTDSPSKSPTLECSDLQFEQG